MGAWARAGWRVWDLGNGMIMLQKLFNPEWQITSKSFLLSSFLIGFSFSPTAEISRLELESEESLPRKTASKGGLDRSQMEQKACVDAWARTGWRVWDKGNSTIMLQKLLNPEWQITSKSFLLASFLIGFSFPPTAEISRLELEFEENLRRKIA